jgi:hypothetical protein
MPSAVDGSLVVPGNDPAMRGWEGGSMIQYSDGDYGKRRYKYHDRGDGMYEAARRLGQQPHLIQTGKYVLPGLSGTTPSQTYGKR